MQGIEHGINREATLALLSSSKVDPSKKAVLRKILAGGVWTQDRKCRAGMVDSGLCPYCNSGVLEDQNHMWHVCPAWKHIRQRYLQVDAEELATWPECLKQCGIVPSKYTVPDDNEEQGLPQNVVDLTRCETRADEVIDVDEDEPCWEKECRNLNTGELIWDGRVVSRLYRWSVEK